MKLHKVLSSLLLETNCPSWFKQNIVKDIAELESKLINFEVMYGVTLEVSVKPYKKPEGRWLGEGMVEEMATMADLYKSKDK